MQSSSSVQNSNFAQSQIQSFNDRLVVVNKNDEPIGSVSKIDAHKTSNINQGMIHRAFSVFIFNQQNELLLQQRSKDKFTFRGLWTNSCCSHPLNTEDERSAIEGTQLAARRRVQFELGLEFDQSVEFLFVQKILYESLQDEQWGEHEVDHIYFVKTNIPSNFVYNQDEIADVKFIGIEGFPQFIQNNPITPWLQKIYDYKLLEWWQLLQKGNHTQLIGYDKNVVVLQ